MSVYLDYPQVLPRYKWLIEDGLKVFDRVFNQFPPYSCKACGENVKRDDWGDHVTEHARQLGLLPDTAAVSTNELAALIRDSLEGRLESIGLIFNKSVYDAVVAGISSVASEAPPEPVVFCADCEEG